MTHTVKHCYQFILAVSFGLVANISFSAETIPLAGDWRFALDRADRGRADANFAKTLPDRIRLPGILEDQGYGDEISAGTPWVLSLYDRNWFLRADYAGDTNAGNVKVPFISQPKRHYLGAAWYQRDIEIPAGWRGQRVELFLERPHWKSTVWLDDREIGSDISLCTPHEYDLGLVPPGAHRLTIRVDNRMILPYRPDAHSVSDSLDDAWNGIAGKMELRATPAVWIADVQVYPNLEKRTVRVAVRIGNETGKPGAGTLYFPARVMPADAMETRMPVTEIPITWTTNGGTWEQTLPLAEQAQAWDEFHPERQRLTVQLADSSAGASAPVTDTQTVTFGLRDFHTEGTQFILNGRPLYLRGTHFGGDFPLTGYPPTDVASWEKIFRTCQEYGLNHMRFHSWCPPEAAFEAADELGVYLLVECGMWNEFTPGGPMEKALYRETDRILRAYGNHPSFLLLSASNEAHGRWTKVLPPWVEHYRKADPRHLYTPDTGWAQIQEAGHVTGADFLVGSSIGGLRQRNTVGWFGKDYGDSLVGIDVPVVAHELGQWCAYPDFDVIQKFTGFVQPGNFEIFRDSAAAHGLLAQNHEFAHASGRFQLACYKEEIEANLRTPGMSGFELLDLHDYTGQGTALVGLLDPFWETKGYVTPDEFKEFCNTVVPLARLKQRVFSSTDALVVPVEAANFSPAPLDVSVAAWQILDAANAVMAEGQFAVTKLPLGKNLPLGTITADLTKLPAPARYSLRVVIGQKSQVRPGLVGVLPPFINEWNFWVYPPVSPVVIPVNNYLETSSPEEAMQALQEGKKVLFTPRLADLSWWSPPLSNVPIFWNALMGPKWSRMLGLWCDTNSPALAQFPTEANCDWQWTELIRNARAVNLDRWPAGLKPIVSAIDDWNRNYKLGVIFEARLGAGKLLVCTADLNAAPVGPQLRRSLVDYMAGDQFQPATEITATDFTGLFFDNLVMSKLGARATCDGAPAKELIDGDPNTFALSADSRSKPAVYPHEILITFPKPVAMAGLVLMPRQNQREHQGDIREYTVAGSADGTNWQTVASGQLASTFDPQTISFGQTIQAKLVRLTARSGFGADNTAALGELAVMYTGPKLPENGGVIKYRRVRTASTDIDAGDAPEKPAKERPKN